MDRGSLFLHNWVFLVFYLAFLLNVINFSSLSNQYPTHSLTNLLWWAHWTTVWSFLGCRSVCVLTLILEYFGHFKGFKGFEGFFFFFCHFRRLMGILVILGDFKAFFRSFWRVWGYFQSLSNFEGIWVILEISSISNYVYECIIW